MGVMLVCVLRCVVIPVVGARPAPDHAVTASAGSPVRLVGRRVPRSAARAPASRPGLPSHTYKGVGYLIE